MSCVDGGECFRVMVRDGGPEDRAWRLALEVYLDGRVPARHRASEARRRGVALSENQLRRYFESFTIARRFGLAGTIEDEAWRAIEDQARPRYGVTRELVGRAGLYLAAAPAGAAPTPSMAGDSETPTSPRSAVSPEWAEHGRWLLAVVKEVAKTARPLPEFAGLVQHELQAFAYAREWVQRNGLHPGPGVVLPPFFGPVSIDTQSHDLPGKPATLPENPSKWPPGVYGGWIPLQAWAGGTRFVRDADRLEAHSQGHPVWLAAWEWTWERARYLLDLHAWLHGLIADVQQATGLKLMLADRPAGTSTLRSLPMDGLLPEFWSIAVHLATNRQFQRLGRWAGAVTESGGYGTEGVYLTVRAPGTKPAPVPNLTWGHRGAVVGSFTRSTWASRIVAGLRGRHRPRDPKPDPNYIMHVIGRCAPEAVRAVRNVHAELVQRLIDDPNTLRLATRHAADDRRRQQVADLFAAFEGQDLALEPRCDACPTEPLPT